MASPSWRATATYVSGGKAFWPSTALALRLHIRRFDHDCVVLGAGRSDLLYALLQRLLPIPRKPTIMVDCLWYDHGSRVALLIKKWLMQLADKSVDRYCVWASREIEAYSRAFGLPREKFVFVPYHTTLDGHELKPENNGYLFSGGNWARDYPTLLKAVEGLPVTLQIACTRPELFSGLTIPANVVIKGYSHVEYLRMMAGCAINIVPLASGLLHSGGQQTFLNSMWLAKPTIVSDPEGASDYITDGVDGLLVPPSDPRALREAILALISDPARARGMGDRARARVTTGYSTDEHFQKIIAIAADLASSRTGNAVDSLHRI